MPGLHLGRNKDIAWSITAAWMDNTDLWQEEINEEFTQYKVDGEWRDLKKTIERISIKGGEAIEQEIYYTHRGVLLDYSTMQFNS